MFIPSDQPDEHRPPVRSLHQRSDKLLAGCGFRCRRLFRRLRSDDKVRGSTPQQTLFLFRGDNSFPQPGSSTRHSGKESKREGISFLEINLKESNMKNKSCIPISGIAIAATVLVLGLVLVCPMLGIPLNDTLYNQLGIIALILTLVGYFVSLLQNNQSIKNFQQVNKQLSGIETSLDELKQQNQPPEGNTRDAVISGLPNGVRCVTVSTRIKNNGRTITSNITVHSHRNTTRRQRQRR